MPIQNSLYSTYGTAIYGTNSYNMVAADNYFRYKCGIEVTSDNYFRYACLGNIAHDCLFRYEAKSEVVTTSDFFRYRNTGWTIGKRKFRYTCKAEIYNDNYFRYTSLAEITKQVYFRYSNYKTESIQIFRYGCPQKVIAENTLRYKPVTQYYLEVIGGNLGGYDVNTNGGGAGAGAPGPGGSNSDGSFPYVNPLQGTLICGGKALPTTYDLGVASFGVSFKESEPSRWTLALLDPLGNYNPLKPGPWFGIMDDKPYSGGGLSKFIISGLTYGGVPFEYIGVPMHYSWTENAQSRCLFFTWSGIDKAEPMFVDSVTFETVRSKLNNKKTAKQIIQTVLGYCNLVGKLDFADFVVPVMHMQNSKPIEFVKSLLECVGAEWRIYGDNIFWAYMPTMAGVSHVFDLSDRVNLIEDISVESQYPDIVNQLIISRAKEVSNSAQGDEEICKDFGVYKHTFQKPMSNIYMRALESDGGFFSTFVCRDVGGNVTAVIDDFGAVYPLMLRANTAYKCKEIEFTWGASPNVIAAGGYGRIRFFGTPVDDFGSATGNTTPGYDEQFTVIATNDESVGINGLRRMEMSPNPLIPDIATAKIFAREYLRRNARAQVQVKYKIPLNTSISVGDNITEVYGKILSRRQLYCTEVSHNFSNNPAELFTLVSACQYDPNFAVSFVTSKSNIPAGSLSSSIGPPKPILEASTPIRPPPS